MNKILAVLASRDRNIPLERMLRSFYWTSTQADVAVYIDDDQQEMYAELMTRLPQVLWHVGPRVGPCKAMNALAAKHPGYAAYGAATDDCEFAATGWDRWVMNECEKMPGGIGCLAPFTDAAFNHGGSRMDFPWVSARWLELLGYLALPGCYCVYWDVALEILAEQTHISRATPEEFRITHDAAISSGASEWFLRDARDAILWLAFERPEVLKKLRAEL